MATSAPMGRLTRIWLAIISLLLAQEIVTVLTLAQDLTPRPQIGLDPTTVTLIGGMIVTIIGTVVTGVVTIITALRVTSVNQAQAVTTTRIDTMAKDTEAIKGHVNSEKTAAEGRETSLRKEVAMLREMVAKQEAAAALLAQAGAVGRRVPIINGGDRREDMLRAPGAPGIAGAPGAAGAPGPVGASGAPGERGAAGTAGEQGERGKQGATGEQGSTGHTGDTGEQGMPGLAALPSINEAMARSLDKIDDHTAAIEKNTAKTDATIADMQQAANADKGYTP